MLPPAPKTRPGRIAIEDVQPTIDCGRYTPKVTHGERVTVSATLLRDGHETLRSVLRHRAPDGGWVELPMSEAPGTDRWHATIVADQLGPHELAVEAWVDSFASWREEMSRRIAGGQEDLASELLEGAALIEATLRRLRGGDKDHAKAAIAAIRSEAP
jgi:starch synthase (maltosyl-transferring)